MTIVATSRQVHYAEILDADLRKRGFLNEIDTILILDACATRHIGLRRHASPTSECGAVCLGHQQDLANQLCSFVEENDLGFLTPDLLIAALETHHLRLVTGVDWAAAAYRVFARNLP